jgi:hypothetical protein
MVRVFFIIYISSIVKVLKDTYCQCKLILHRQPIEIVQPFISYQESEVKWNNVAEKNTIVIRLLCKIISHTLWCIKVI